MTPQQLNDILKERTQPTGEQALHLQELTQAKPTKAKKSRG